MVSWLRQQPVAVVAEHSRPPLTASQSGEEAREREREKKSDVEWGGSKFDVVQSTQIWWIKRMYRISNEDERSSAIDLNTCDFHEEVEAACMQWRTCFYMLSSPGTCVAAPVSEGPFSAGYRLPNM